MTAVLARNALPSRSAGGRGYGAEGWCQDHRRGGLNSEPAVLRRAGHLLLDDGLAWVLAALAAAGSFSHIRVLALRSGQHGWMANATAVCIDMMCVMAVRERKRDQRLGRECGRLTWPTVVLTMGICLTIAANLATAQRTPWGWVVAATPAATFLIAVSMLERRASLPDQPTNNQAPAEVPRTFRTATPLSGLRRKFFGG